MRTEFNIEDVDSFFSLMTEAEQDLANKLALTMFNRGDNLKENEKGERIATPDMALLHVIFNEDNVIKYLVDEDMELFKAAGSNVQLNQ